MDAHHSGIVTAEFDVQQDAATFRCPGVDAVSVPLSLIACSKLLRDMMDSADTTARVSVPLSWGSMQLWLGHVQQRDRTADGSNTSNRSDRVPFGEVAASVSRHDGRVSSAVPQDETSSASASIDEWCKIMMAADVLIDEATKHDCSAGIAALLQRPAEDSTPDPFEGLAGLLEHLQLAVFSCIPLHRCLESLPRYWWQHALRAHHPSIDTTATLHLHALPSSAVPAAALAASDLHNLHALSLAGLTLPHDSAPCLRPLREIPTLTALDLRDIGLREPSAAALCAALLALPRLHILNLSHNLITAPLMHALAAALQHCTSLRALDLSKTLEVENGTTAGLRPLAAACAALTALTFLSVGAYHYEEDHRDWPHTQPSDPPASDCETLLQTLAALPALLTLQLKIYDSGARAAALFNGLSTLAHLRSLNCSLHDPPPYPGSVRDPPTKSLIHLTALQFSIHSDLHALHSPRTAALHGAGTAAAGALAILPNIPHLGHLAVKLHISGNREATRKTCDALAMVLPHLYHLTRLDALAGATDPYSLTILEQDVESVLALVEAASAAPRLRAMRAPALVFPCAALARLTAALRLAAESREVTVDAIMTCRGEGSSGYAAAFGSCEPLFPLAQTLEFYDYVHGDTLESLMASQGALRGLRELSIMCCRIPDANASHESAYAHILNAVSSLSHLVSLKCMSNMGFWKQAPADAVHGLAGFLRGLGDLKALTQLKFSIGLMNEQFQVEYVGACARLPRLEVWDLGFFNDLPRSCDEVLPQLTVKVLYVTLAHVIEDSINIGVSPGFADWAARCLPHLECLRTLFVTGRYDDAALRSAAERTPGFQLLQAASFSGIL